jgi:murein DD-endopeptidase MepM/ murein hydrolase activator NlpD
MSSLHQDHLLTEGPEPVSGTGSTPAPARENSRRPVGTGEEKAASSVPTQRQGKAQRSGSSSTSTAPTTEAAPVQRPTPHRRTAAQATAVEPAVVEQPAVEAAAVEVVAALARGRHRGAHRRPASPRRRTALYLAAALVGAMGLGAFSAGNPDARAETATHSVSVASLLGVHGQPEKVTAADAGRLGELAASRNQRGAEQAAAATAQAVANQKAAEALRPKVVLPVHGARLTSTFGMRWGTLHAGIDLAAPLGTPEYAAMDGVVLRAGPASGFGLAVYIQHANGDVTVYGHMEKILVTDGQVVRAGDTIALLGAEGEATGPHLHFEVHVGGIMGQKIDPLPWLRERGVSI